MRNSSQVGLPINIAVAWMMSCLCSFLWHCSLNIAIRTSCMFLGTPGSLCIDWILWNSWPNVLQQKNYWRGKGEGYNVEIWIWITRVIAGYSFHFFLDSFSSKGEIFLVISRYSLCSLLTTFRITNPNS